MKIAGVDTVDD